MKKLLIAVILATVMAVAVAPVVLAGDKVRGENGEGDVVQTCVNFDECPYGDESPMH